MNTDINYAPKLLNGLETLWKDRTFIGESYIHTAQGRHPTYSGQLYNTDTTLVVGDREIPVHRCVLSAVSGYFRSMFAGSLRESFEPERIELKEVEPEVLIKLIEYCYTSIIHINQDNVMNILKTADLLQVYYPPIKSRQMIGQIKISDYDRPKSKSWILIGRK